MMKTVYVTHAVKEELIPLEISGWNIHFILTGIGKARSAMCLTEAVMNERPDMVINIGTAGSLIHNIGDILVCRKFIDRDYKASQLPGVEYEIDCSNALSQEVFIGNWIANCKKTGICSTGDSFVTEINKLEEDVVDMESYAQALVCDKFNIPFLAVKYITDIIGKNSVKHWEDKLTDARNELAEWFRKYTY